MPNVTPKGLFVRPTPTTSAAAADAWVWDGSTWRLVDKVFAWDGIGWAVVWSRSATSPSAVTLTWATSQVTVSWTLPSPETVDGYVIRRPDGSLAGSVAAGVTSFVDLNPLPLNGAYTVHGTLGGVEAAGVASAALDLRMLPTSLSATMLGSGTASPSVVLGWAWSRQPDAWVIRRGGVIQATLAGSTTTWTDTGPPTGVQSAYTITAQLSGVESATPGNLFASVAPAPPTGATLTATNPPINTLRLAWSAPGGTWSSFEVQRGDGTTWTAHATTTGLTSDWTTAVAGYMRVRATQPGVGSSAWVTVGPVTPITDVTPPSEVFIAEFVPESTYGRMVLRAYLSTDADLASYRVVTSWDGVVTFTLIDWTTGTPGQFIVVNTHNGAAGQTAWVRVDVRDTTGNTRIGAWRTYTLLASPQYVAPTDAGTYRGGVWRNDAAVDANDFQTGGTSSGQNTGCYFYGDQVNTLVGTRTVTGIKLFLQRRDINGNSSAIQPLLWTHNLASKSGAPTLDGHGLADAARLAPAMTRTGATANAQWWMPSEFVNAFVFGTVKGLAAYRTGGVGSPDQFYMALQEAAVNFSGLMEIHHLG